VRRLNCSHDAGKSDTGVTAKEFTVLTVQFLVCGIGDIKRPSAAKAAREHIRGQQKCHDGGLRRCKDVTS
jgi:hypothetical protein